MISSANGEVWKNGIPRISNWSHQSEYTLRGVAPNVPKSQRAFVKVEILDMVYSKSGVHCRDPVLMLIDVEFGRLDTMTAFSCVFPPTRTSTDPTRSLMLAKRFRNGTWRNELD